MAWHGQTMGGHTWQMFLEPVFAHVVWELSNGAVKVIIRRASSHQGLHTNTHTYQTRPTNKQIQRTSNCVSKMVFPVSGTVSIISLTLILSSGALMELSPHMIDSSKASWMNTYWGYKETPQFRHSTHILQRSNSILISVL